MQNPELHSPNRPSAVGVPSWTSTLQRIWKNSQTAIVSLSLVGASLVTPPLSAADGPRALPEGKVPEDARLNPVKDLDGYFPFEPSVSKEEWEVRAEYVRRQLQVSLGLWPLPERTPLNPVIHGKVEKDGYTIERVYFESFPGFFVTGSLYRPTGKSGKLPAVLCPHGHWANGRFYDCGEKEIQAQLANGAEKFPDSGRSPLQARAVHLARMGCVVFFYDMIGYADNTQLSFDLAHRFGKQRPEMNSDSNWGLFSPQAEGQLQSIMGLQSYNSIRALDFISSLPDVDTSRIGVTGASGGGTQTFILGAIDPRPATVFPAVMVSTAMQGGCTCENCSLLRVNTGNVEFAALFAPKPQGMTAADDWTKEMETKGFPQLKKHYEMLGAGDKVHLTARLEYGHNYNFHGRKAMYEVFNSALNLNADSNEKDFERLSTEQMTVWDKDHPQPAGGDDFERKLLKTWTEDAKKQLNALIPSSQDSFEKYQKVVGGAIDVVIGRKMPPASAIEYEATKKEDRGNYFEILGVVQNKTAGEALPVAFFYPKEWNGKAILWFSGAGKNGLYQDGKPNAHVQKLIASGYAVGSADLLFQGEFNADGKTPEKTRRVANTREAAGYTFGYNHSLAAQRIHDVMTMVSFAKNYERQPSEIILVGNDGAGQIVTSALPQVGNAVTECYADTAGFRYHGVKDLHDPNFLPGAAKYFDLPGFISLAPQVKVYLASEDEKSMEVAKKVFDATGHSDNLHFSPSEGAVERMIEHLTR